MQLFIPETSAAAFVPIESGTHLLRLTAAEFDSRCMKAFKVTIEQSRALRARLWRMHIDSKHVDDTLDGPATKPQPPLSKLDHVGKTSSRDMDPKSKTMHFKERIRPGMVVSWSRDLPQNCMLTKTDDSQLGVVLCPENADREALKPISRNGTTPTKTLHSRTKSCGADGVPRYICARLSPGSMFEAYELNLWHQAVVDVNMMDREVVVEYDSATRYYHLAA